MHIVGHRDKDGIDFAAITNVRNPVE